MTMAITLSPIVALAIDSSVNLWTLSNPSGSLQQLAHQQKRASCPRPLACATGADDVPELSDSLRFVVFATAFNRRRAHQINILRVAH
jgi:hypothetical protein